MRLRNDTARRGLAGRARRPALAVVEGHAGWKVFDDPSAATTTIRRFVDGPQDALVNRDRCLDPHIRLHVA
jgi:hypothetical protein